MVAGLPASSVAESIGVPVACGGAVRATTALAAGFDAALAARKAEADAFYASVVPAGTPTEEATVARQALAGLL